MANKLYEALESRILLLDGGFGTMELQENPALSDCRLYWFRQNNFYTLYYFQSVKMRCPYPLSGCKKGR